MKELKVELNVENFRKARDFIEKELKSNGISKEIILENMLVFEALYNRILEQDCAKSTIEISIKKRIGDLSINIGFEGKMFIPLKKSDEEVSPENKIMRAYDDKLSYKYHSSYNIITLVVKRGHQKALLYCFIALALAIIVYAIINPFLDESVKKTLLLDYVFPTEKLYTNAMFMVGAPMTLFSLMKNIMDTYIISERSSIARRVQTKTVITSIIAIAIAAFAFFIFAVNFDGFETFTNYTVSVGRQSYSEIMETLVPSNIFEPFSSISPFPIIVIALLSSYAFCSVGKHFEGMKKVVDACYTFFSKMLNIVMCALPFFCFVSILDFLLDEGYIALLEICLFLAIVVIGLAMLLIFYYLRLKVARVNVKQFLSKLGPFLKENLRINSAIDAAAFNTRYCIKNYGYDRKRLEESLPTLAQINLDGNCLILMLAGCTVMFFGGTDVNVAKCVGLAIIVFFLSLGAPNQPGSIFIGMLIIVSYLNIPALICIAIYFEVIFGRIQNLINVLGDIVTVATEEASARRQLGLNNKNS